MSNGFVQCGDELSSLYVADDFRDHEKLHKRVLGRSRTDRWSCCYPILIIMICIRINWRAKATSSSRRMICLTFATWKIDYKTANHGHVLRYVLHFSAKRQRLQALAETREVVSNVDRHRFDVRGENVIDVKYAPLPIRNHLPIFRIARGAGN